VVIEMGSDDPVASMDATGKLVIGKNNDVQTGTVKGFSAADGEKIPVQLRDLGSTEIFPQSLQHNCNGRFVAVCGDGEFIVYTSQALRNKAFGSALNFVWSARGTGDYAIRESISRLKL
jgi:coatomer subunit beta'